MEKLKQRINSGSVVDSSDFFIIPSDGPSCLTKRQRHPMIMFQDHFSKMGDIDKQYSWRSADKDIDSMYVCSHCSYKCSCIFVLMKDGSGKIISNHVDDVRHFLDPHLVERYKFGVFAKHEINKNSNMTATEIITKYITQKDFVVTPFTPYRSYMNQRINTLKSELLGKTPRKLEDIDIDELSAKFPEFSFRCLDYENDKHEKRFCFVIYNQFMVNIAKRPLLEMIGDGTFAMVPDMFAQLYTLHAVVG